MTDLQNISRIDQEVKSKRGYVKATHCWVVRIGKVKKRVKLHKTFSDNKYGGKEQALLAAIEFRNQHASTERRVFINPNPRILPVPFTLEERLERQKAYKRKKYVLGTGMAAAQKARDMGASINIISRIKRGVQDFFYCQGAYAKYKLFGFPNAKNITPQLEQKIRSIILATYSVTKSELVEITQEVLLFIGALDPEIPTKNQDALIQSRLEHIVYRVRRKKEEVCGSRHGRVISYSGLYPKNKDRRYNKKLIVLAEFAR